MRHQTLLKRKSQKPATNAVSERSFSALKRVKTYLRSTTGDSRLNHLMMLRVHKYRTDALSLVDVANDFVGEKENRKKLFSKFSTKISQTSSLFRQSQHTQEITDKTRRIVQNCSDLTCTTKYALTEGPKRGRGGGGGREEINVSYSLSAPSHFLLATGLNPAITIISRGEKGYFPFSQKFRKFRFGAKWKTFFSVLPTGKFPEKVELLRR